MFLQFLAWAVVAASGISGSDASKPACNAQNMGRFWPEAANHDHAAVNKLARCGELEICTRGPWHYHWQALTVTVDQLRGVKSKPASCMETSDNESAPGTAASNSTK